MSVATKKHKKLNHPKLLQTIKLPRRTLKTFCQLQYLILRKRLSKQFVKKRKLHDFQQRQRKKLKKKPCVRLKRQERHKRRLEEFLRNRKRQLKLRQRELLKKRPGESLRSTNVFLLRKKLVVKLMNQRSKSAESKKKQDAQLFRRNLRPYKMPNQNA